MSSSRTSSGISATSLSNMPVPATAVSTQATNSPSASVTAPTTSVSSTSTLPAPIPDQSSSTSTAIVSNIRVSLSIPLLPKEKLYPTPSMADNLKYDDEFDLRLTGCELIQTSGRLLKLPQVIIHIS